MGILGCRPLFSGLGQRERHSIMQLKLEHAIRCCAAFAAAGWMQGCAGVALHGSDHLDDRLLLLVAEVPLEEMGDAQCVRQNLPGGPGNTSDWLLERLRRRLPKLVQCPQDDFSDEELWLGPVVWQKPGKEGVVYWGFPGSVVSQDGFHIIRGKFGRWRFFRMTRE